MFYQSNSLFHQDMSRLKQVLAFSLSLRMANETRYVRDGTKHDPGEILLVLSKPITFFRPQYLN